MTIKYRCKGPCDLGKNKEISELDANAMYFRCTHCGAELVHAINENMLGPADLEKCTNAIKKLQKKFEVFNEYVIPANFFGPGRDFAYVGPGTTQQFEDIQNVNFNFYKGKDFLGSIKKQKVPVSFRSNLTNFD